MSPAISMLALSNIRTIVEVFSSINDGSAGFACAGISDDRDVAGAHSWRICHAAGLCPRPGLEAHLLT
jgi:hypothetical protein